MDAVVIQGVQNCLELTRSMVHALTLLFNHDAMFLAFETGTVAKTHNESPMHSFDNSAHVMLMERKKIAIDASASSYSMPE